MVVKTSFSTCGPTGRVQMELGLHSHLGRSKTTNREAERCFRTYPSNGNVGKYVISVILRICEILN